MQHNKVRWLWILPLVILLLVCATPFLVSAFPPTPPTRAAFVQAYQQWQTRPFSHYEFILVYWPFGDRCTYTLAVSDQEESVVQDTTCSESDQTPPRSISQLFTLLEPYATQWKCGPNGCGCDRIALDVSYDSRWGYPMKASIQQAGPMWWQHWSRIFQGKLVCSLIGTGGVLFEIEQFRPLP